MIRKISSVLLALSIVAAPVSAQTITGSATGLGATSQTINFDGGTNGSAVGSQGGVSFIGLLYGSPFLANGGSNSALNFDINARQWTFSNPISILFSQAVKGAAFEYISFPGQSTFTAYFNGFVVNSFTTPTDFASQSSPAFFGFDNSVTLDRIDVSVAQVGANDAMAIDNLQVGVVAAPEPASLVLLATGLVGVAGLAARRRRQTQA